MTKEHPLAVQLRQAADDENALFKSEAVNMNVSIACVVNNPEYDWKLYEPPKPDKELYIPYYGSAVGWAHETHEKALQYLSNGGTHIIKVTTNGETGKVTAEVIEL